MILHAACKPRHREKVVTFYQLVSFSNYNAFYLVYEITLIIK